MPKKIKFLKVIVGICCAWFGLHTVYIVADGLIDHHQNADLAIVLGNKINHDGTLSERLKQRLNQSIELYNQKRIKFILVSGGFGKEGFFEADEMKNYLIQNQIPADRIIVDNQGSDTEKTVQNSIQIMKAKQLSSAITVSQYFHQTRIKQIFHKNGFTKVQSSSPLYFELRDFYSIFREFFAFYLEAVSADANIVLRQNFNYW
jgi:vancomycin permeability regulator SanA